MEFDPTRVPISLPTPAKSLRIAVVTETYPPEVNGVARTVARIVEGLLKNGHSVQLIRPRTDSTSGATHPFLTELLTRGCPIPRYPQLKLGLPAGQRLGKLWQGAPPDVIHIATEGPLGASALRTARRLGIPTVSEFRTNFDAYTQYYGVGCLHRVIRGYLRAFHNRTGYTMVPTHRLAQELSSAGFQNLSVVARGVDARQFHPSRRSEALRNSWGASPSTQVVIGVGRLAPEKNLDTLVAAFQGMRRRNPDTKLVLVGDGPCRAKTESKCPEAIFAGMRSGQDLATHYASADVLLFPSITETYGNVTLEAMASGLAVVAYDYAAASQLIDQGQSGFLARYNDTADFLRLAEEVATSKEHVRRLGEKGRIRAETMDWESIIHQVEEHYFKVIQRQPKRHSIPASDMVLAG